MTSPRDRLVGWNGSGTRGTTYVCDSVQVEPSRSNEHIPAPDIGPDGARTSFRAELDTTHHHLVDEGWAGGIPAQYGVAPRVRIGKSKWFNLLWLIPIGFLLLVIGIAVAKGIRELPAVQDFIASISRDVDSRGRPGRPARMARAGSTSSTCS